MTCQICLLHSLHLAQRSQAGVVCEGPCAKPSSKPADLPCLLRSTACTPLRREDASSTSRVKVITDLNGYALYFSRGVLPGNKSGEPQPFPIPFQDHQYLLHLGLQCYDSSFLKTYCHLPATPLMVGSTLPSVQHASLFLAASFPTDGGQVIPQVCLVHVQPLYIFHMQQKHAG